MQTRSYDKNSVSQTRALWQNRRKICLHFIPYERSFIWEEEWLVGATPATLNFESSSPRWSEIADFEQIIARKRLSRNTCQKVQLKLIGSRHTRFPISLRWSSYVAPKSPQRGSKTQNDRFSSKIAFRLKKVCNRVHSCENCQRQSWRRAFIGLTIHAKMIGGERPFHTWNFGSSDRVGAKSLIFDLFSLVAPQP